MTISPEALVKGRGRPVRIHFKNNDTGGLSVIDETGRHVGTVVDVASEITFCADIEITVDRKMYRRGMAKVVLGWI